MSTELARTVLPSPWRQQPGETPTEYLEFCLWLIDVGPVNDELATRYRWAQRRQTIETYEAAAELTPADATMAQVRIYLVEAMKLQARVMASPESQLTPAEVQKGIEWMITAQQGLLERNERALDWSQLAPEEREIMLQAKEIQDRLLAKVVGP